jgi:hypothetical protein
MNARLLRIPALIGLLLIGGGWTDTPAVIAAAVAPVEDALRGCLRGGLPRRLGMYATRGDGGATVVNMPMPPVGVRGLTAEERCLMRTIARIELPPLPAPIERLGIGFVVVAAGEPAAPVDAAFSAWRDPAATLAPVIDAHLTALAACDRRPRTVRLVVDLRRGRTRVWLPAWQFSGAPAGVKVCLRRVIGRWRLPVLPRSLGEMQLAIPTS